MLVDLVEDRLGGAAQVAGAVGERELRPERLDLGDLVDHALDRPPGAASGTEPTARRSVGLNDSSVCCRDGDGRCGRAIERAWSQVGQT